MDPITQGLLGAAAAQAVWQKKLPKNTAWIVGLAAGMAADLDIFVRVPGEPASGWLYHRQFTHSLAFVPVGAALAALPFLLYRPLREEWKYLYAAAVTAYLTHPLLDAATAYGTVLFWPFSDMRVAWDWIGIVDLFFTPILLIGVVTAALMKVARPAQIALGLACLYMGVGAVHNQRALSAQRALAEARGHQRENPRAMPSPGSLVLWRSLYIHDGVIYADGIRTGWFRQTLVAPGTSFPLATFEDLTFLNEDAAERARPHYETIEWFSAGFPTPVEGEANVLADGRYSMGLREMNPMWGMAFSEEGEAWQWRPSRDSRSDYSGRLWQKLRHGDPDFLPVAEALERKTAAGAAESSTEEPGG